MAVTYTDTLATDRDRVRFHIGDTVESSGPLPGDSNFSDNELDGLLDDEGNWQRAVAAAFEALAARWAKHPTFEDAGFKLDRNKIAEHYAKKAVEWRKKAAVYGVAPYAGGISASDKDTYEDDTDRTVPAFTRDAFTVAGNEPADEDILGER